MKNIIKKVKGKRVLSFVLAAIMLATTFNIALPMLKLDASAQGETINGITQTRIVPDGTYQSVYSSYASAYLNGYGEPTELVIPGLTKANNYVVQGIAYYPEKNWALVTAYHNKKQEDNPSPSMIYCIDVATGDFVAMFSFINVDGTPNTDHGGGIAISENNIYYSCGDMDRSIAYAPLSAIEGIENDASKYRTVQLVDEVTFYETGSVTNNDGETAYTAYCCYDQGILWTGNFYDKGVAGIIAADYNVKAHNDYPSMVWGYELSGNSSEEEWAKLVRNYNKIHLSTTDAVTITGTGATMTYTTVDKGTSIDITGSVTYDGTVATVGELTSNFGYYYLEEGNTYTIEYTATNDSSYGNEIFLFAPNGTHTNIHQSSACKRTDLGNGTYKYQLTFKAGTAPVGANSTWAANGSGSYTGKYTIRFDQNSITASRDFSITGLSITCGDGTKTSDEKVAAVTADHQGNPSYVIALPSDIIDVQYATVDDGRLYLSRSYGTGTETCQNVGMEPYSQLSIADIDLSVNGSGTITFTTDANGNTRTVNNAYIVPSLQTFDFMPMAEGLCVIDDYIYMTFESATYKYYKDAGVMGNCDVPVDVVWKIDQYGLLGHERPDAKPVTAYEKVKDVSEISSTDEYIVVYESEMKAEGNQNNILYALNSYGGYQGGRIPKTDSGTVVSTMDSMGMIGHQITDYHTYMNTDGEEFLILGDAVSNDVPNIRWNLIGAGTGAMRFHSVDLYNAEYSYLYFDQRLMYMSTENNTNLNDIVLVNKTVDGITYPGEFFIYNSANSSYLWCNDGSDESIMTAYNDYYQIGDTTHKYYGQTEIPGTFHADAFKTASGDASGNQSSFGSSTYRMTTYSGEATNSRAASASADPYELATFSIYKRITTDPNTMGGTGLETDLKAELQPDGTYTINLGTYATSEAHKYLGESGYPTDFMFVLDASGSMTNNNDYVTYQSEGIKPISRGMANDRTGYYVYVDEYIDDNRVAQPVNQFCLLDGHWDGNIFSPKCWVGAKATDGNEYFLNTDGKFYWRESQITKVKGNDTAITDTLPVYRKVTTSRLQGMKDTVNSFISKIDANAQTYNIEHRVAITTFGSDSDESYLNTGIYSTLSGTALNTYGADLSAHYAAAFYPSNHSNLKTIVNGIDTTIDDPDTFANIGMEMAVNAYEHQSPAYGGAGDRYYSDFTDSEGIFHEKNANAVVIFLTDGCPGYGGSDSATATTVANEAIPHAQAIKGAGGVVYSVQVSNATMDGFDMSAYMNGVTSNYPSATSLTSLGTKGSSDYYVKAATDGSVDVNLVLNDVFKHIEDNYIDIGTSITLGTDSIVRQVLGSHFQLTSESTVTTSTSSVSEDVLGNIKFGDAVKNNISVEKDVDNNTIKVTGFDYSANYYAKNKKEGKRLNIVIDNVLPVDIDEDSLKVIDQTRTAIYENQSNMNSNKKFKGYPNVEFTIPQYTYALDYGFPMRDTDINGTLCAVSPTLSKQDPNNYVKKALGGDLAIEPGNQNLIYKIDSKDNNVSSGYTLIKRDDGTYDWFKINIVPASNVLYEESALTLGKVEERKAYHWNGKGSPAITYQDLSTEKDVYGYDNHYKSSTKHSNDTYYQSSVDSVNKRSDTAVFKFNGTGFDLISACGPTTGVQLVNIKRDGKMVRGFIVDTYYDGKFVSDGEDKFYQVPIVNWDATSENLADDVYGEYTVEVTSYYLSSSEALKNHQANQTTKKKIIDTGLVMNYAKANEAYGVEDILADAGISDTDKVDIVWFDDNSVLNGGTGASVKKGSRAVDANGKLILDNYIDGIRVYNPIQDTSSYIESERNATYYNIIDELASENDILNGTINSNVAFVTGSLSEGTLSFANYESIGPEGEFYLEAGSNTNKEALVFNTLVAEGGRVMISLRAVNGTTTAKIKETEFAINSATEMYYDITDLLTVGEDGKATVSIINTGSGILSVNNIKLTSPVSTTSLMMLSMDDLETVQYYATMDPVQATVENGVVTPVEDEEDIPEDNTNTDNDNTNDDANTEESEKEEFSLFSLIEMLIAFIEKILYNAFGAGSMA